MDHTTPRRFTVASHLSDAVWTFTEGVSTPAAAADYYATVNQVPVESVSIGTRTTEVSR